MKIYNVVWTGCNMDQDPDIGTEVETFNNYDDALKYASEIAKDIRNNYEVDSFDERVNYANGQSYSFDAWADGRSSVVQESVKIQPVDIEPSKEQAQEIACTCLEQNMRDNVKDYVKDILEGERWESKFSAKQFEEICEDVKAKLWTDSLDDFVNDYWLRENYLMARELVEDRVMKMDNEIKLIDEKVNECDESRNGDVACACRNEHQGVAEKEER